MSNDQLHGLVLISIQPNILKSGQIWFKYGYCHVIRKLAPDIIKAINNIPKGFHVQVLITKLPMFIYEMLRNYNYIIVIFILISQ